VKVHNFVVIPPKALAAFADSDHDGRVEFQEFRSYVEKRRIDMERAFDKLDADTDGKHLGGINSPTLVSPVSCSPRAALVVL
jgi:hypothetical protein